jgi:hypothetical protein
MIPTVPLKTTYDQTPVYRNDKTGLVADRTFENYI